MDNPLISVCMPVYNAAPYLAQAIEGILSQSYSNWELIICDNKSTDSSAEIAQEYATRDRRIQFVQNQWNIGFSGNAHKTTSLAKGDFILLHAADDVASSDALATYVATVKASGFSEDSLVLLSDFGILDQSGELIGTSCLDYPSVKFVAANDETGSGSDNGTGISIETHDGQDILKDRLPTINTYGWVGTVLFSRKLLERTEGYYSNHWVNPDKYFMFKLLYINPKVIWVRKPLFQYRLHDFNQNSQQRGTGIVKYLLDQYAFTFELPQDMLHDFAHGREDMIHFFIEHDCLRAALREIALGNRKSGFRHLCFGLATYPDYAWKNLKTYAAMFLWLLGPLGTLIASKAYGRYVSRNQDRFPDGPRV